MFITFEGIDGSGKSTQIRLLKEKLKGAGHIVYVFREPGGVTLSEKVRSLLLDSELEIHPVTELLLFSSARAQLVTEKVKPLLQENKIVILDRYYDSTTAYQGYGRASLPLKDIYQLNKIASHNLVPDVTFYLRLSLEEARQRTRRDAKDRMEQSGTDFYRKVIKGFDEIAENEARFEKIEATGTPEQTHELIMSKMKELL